MSITNQQLQPIPQSLTISGVTASAEYHARNSDLAAHGYRELVREQGEPSLGYEPAVASEQDGKPIWYVALKGTPEERAAAQHEAYLDRLSCTKLQGKLALIQAGYWSQYEALIASLLPSMTPAQRVFVEDAQTWMFRDPVLQMFATAIEIDEQEVISLLELAQTL